jgi:large subunit ribosomal protein L32
MAVPKRKTSKQRKHIRAACWKTAEVTLGECPQCHEPKLSHRVCKCGYYKNKKIIEQKAAKAE